MVENYCIRPDGRSLNPGIEAFAIHIECLASNAFLRGSEIEMVTTSTLWKQVAATREFYFLACSCNVHDTLAQTHTH